MRSGGTAASLSMVVAAHSKGGRKSILGVSLEEALSAAEEMLR